MTRPIVCGVDVDSETRCKHWHSPRDIIAIRMKCCGAYYACKDCHDQLAGHAPQVWPKSEWDTKGVLCGACGSELSIAAYLGCDSRCPACAADFNPGCAIHHHFYFEF
ncbi:MAG TPA: CHY zinc finger protein [Rhizomicrobium sp.]|nr:CHY zinc finger protein [Rhizomicrobium sp.]